MMVIVEQRDDRIYPPFVWARDIKVSVCGQDLEVSGVVPVLEEDVYAAPDPLRAYRRAMSRYGGAKRQGKNAPHVQFANAGDVQKQIAFIRRYGPFVVSWGCIRERAIKAQGPFDFDLSESLIVARQNLVELEREQLVYRSALALISELRHGKEADIGMLRKCISVIVDNIAEWPSQWERERRLRAGDLGYEREPQWTFTEETLRHLELWRWEANREGEPLRDAFVGPDPLRAGHLVACELVNAFRPVVYPWGHSPVEAPHWDIRAGIRPILYYMMRREYFSAGGLGVCRNSDCRAIFEIERSGQEFCSEECSRLQRQREYWSIRGKKLRQRRLAQREISSLSRGRKTPKEK